MNLKYKIGYRAIKTTFAVFICLLINFFFNKSTAFYAVIAAILCVQPTINASKHVGVHRIIGTILGSIFSFVTLELDRVLPYYNHFLYLLIVPLFVLILIYLCNIFLIKDSIAVATITFVVIAFINNGEISHTLLYVIDRTLQTILGVIVGIVVNQYVFVSKTASQDEPK